MALKTNNSAVAIAIQGTVDTFTTPTQPADLMPISSLRMQIDGVTVANDELTGSPFKNADAVAGKRVTLSYNVKLRPPGGTVPSANAFLLGRVLQAAKMTEVRTATAIPAAPEALGAGSTTTAATLGATAAGTADLYKGMALILPALGTGYKNQLTAIRSYSAAKVAVLPETAGATITGNYQIPAQIGYMRDVSAADPIYLSHSVWLDGHRFDLMNCRLASMQLVLPTSTKQQASYPEVQVSFDCTISANAAQATPSVPGLGAIPLIKDGDCWLANVRVGSSTMTLDMGLQLEFPPNPNKTDGSDAGEIVSGTATASMTRQKYLPAVLDTLALADAQSNNSLFLQWGTGVAGGMVQVLIPDFRFNYQSPDTGGAIINETGSLLIDALARGVCVTFPY